MAVEMAMQMTGQMSGEPPRRPRVRWLAAAGLALAIVVVLPPLETLARRYVLVESAQFCVLAMVAPALIVLGAPWSIAAMGAPSARGPTSGTWSPRAVRLARARLERPDPRRAAVVLVAWIAAAVIWRLPAVLDALQRHPVLILLEVATVLSAGAALWLELMPSPPFTPRVGRPLRACIAAVAMWSIWGVAYVLGFATGGVVHGYDPAGSGLGTVADQEIAVGVLWAVSGVCFIPVIFTTLITWLRDGAGSDIERAPERSVPGSSGIKAVKGWGRPTGLG